MSKISRSRHSKFEEIKAAGGWRSALDRPLRLWFGRPFHPDCAYGEMNAPLGRVELFAPVAKPLRHVEDRLNKFLGRHEDHVTMDRATESLVCG